jgi:hypothetical protein
LEKRHSVGREIIDLADEEKVIPWAEGNGLWRTLSNLASDLVGADIVTFFVQNPHAFDTAEGLAIHIGRRPAQIEPVLRDLAAVKFLKEIDLGGSVVYELTEDPHRRQTLQQYVAWLKEGYHWVRMVMNGDC